MLARHADPRRTAHGVVATAPAQRPADDIDPLRELELARLDALQASRWAKAEKGDLRAPAYGSSTRGADRPLGLYGYQEAQEPHTLVIDHRGNPGKATGAVFRRSTDRCQEQTSA